MHVGHACAPVSLLVVWLMAEPSDIAKAGMRLGRQCENCLHIFASLNLVWFHEHHKPPCAHPVTTPYPLPCPLPLYPLLAEPFAYSLWSASRQEHVVCCWLCYGFAISIRVQMCAVPCQHGFHDFGVMSKLVLWFRVAKVCWLLPCILQVFSFSGNAMPDDISIMTMAGERTRSGPPKDVKQ